MHEKGVIHSDIKAVTFDVFRIQTPLTNPLSLQDNVVVSDDRRAIVCDFGTSCMEQSSLPLAVVSTTTKGTIQCWAPESCDYLNPIVKQTKESDVWAFGIIIYAS